MEIPEQLACLYTAELTETEEGYSFSVPASEVEQGSITPGETLRVAVLAKSDGTTDTRTPTETSEATPQRDDPTPSQPEPPVSEGETRVVEIEDVGDQGDGITRVERGYVVIVPETDEGETVEIRIETVQPNVAFGTVIDRLDHAE
ncbi:TRAM domain-containing protein [Halonotius roseus]|jgi:predicted RNA-binding protein with TRAM domain|uniref:TRAM domain-containing protein n=1 Tax=Halonotius roseus TaxID=2511997 RepID=A0A544QQB8_9EURY|nr:TRAM domain-containing protein [Halonotius roseus]TQQ81630.1 TRAM domain-containing protein [Halonotius roseus]